MPLNFPDSPSLNEIYTSGSNVWIFDGTVWNASSSVIVGPAGSIGATGPTGADGSVGGNIVTTYNGLTGDVFTPSLLFFNLGII
jgi:hypothetical protein